MIRAALRRLRRDRRGNLLIESAFAIPLLVVLLAGGFEVARLFLLYNKVNRAASEVNDIVSRLGMGSGAPVTVCRSLFTDIFSSVDDIMNPYNDGARVHLVMTGVNNDGATPKVLWQMHNPPSETGYSDVSASGTPGAAAAFPAASAFALTANQSAVVTEITYNYAPLVFGQMINLLPFLTPRDIKQTVIMAPRAAYIDTIDNSC